MPFWQNRPFWPSGRPFRTAKTNQAGMTVGCQLDPWNTGSGTQISTLSSLEMSASQSTISMPASCRTSTERLGVSDESIACLVSSKSFWSRVFFLAALELALSACGTNFTGARSSASSAARPGGGSTRTSLLASSTLRLVWGTSGASGVGPMSSAEDGTDSGSGAGGSGSAEGSAGGSADGSAGVGSADGASVDWLTLLVLLLRLPPPVRLFALDPFGSWPLSWPLSDVLADSCLGWIDCCEVDGLVPTNCCQWLSQRPLLQELRALAGSSLPSHGLPSPELASHGRPKGPT